MQAQKNKKYAKVLKLSICRTVQGYGVCEWIWCGTVLRVFKVTPYSHSNGNNLKIRLPLKQQNIYTCFEKQGNNFLHTAHTHVAEKTRKHCASHSILLLLLQLPSLKGYEQNY